MADWPPSLKPIGKYIVRAREVKDTEPLVAYYCNYYALKRAIELRDTTDQNAHRLVTGLLEKCEADKAALGTDDGSHRGIVEEFALSVFDRADNEDREDRATRETAQTFYSALCFFEVCRVFGPLPSDLEQRLRYAKWKAVEISKALKEGRRPTPGAPGEAEAIEEQRRAAEEQKAVEQAAPSAPPPELTDGVSGRQDFGSPRRQSDENVPPAPPVREYESDIHEYQPQPGLKERSDGSGRYPSVAPPYPSADISPLPHQAPRSTAANHTSAYPSMTTAYPTTDASYRASDSTYPSTSGYPASNVPYIAPYATEDLSQRKPEKGPVMPPIPSLDIPGIGTNMGDPPPGQPIYPPETEASHWPPPSESSFAPPRSNPYAPPESNSSYPPPHLDAPFAPPRSNAPYAAPRPDHGHERSRPDTSYPPRPGHGHEQSRPDTSYPPRPDRGHEQSRPDTSYPPRPDRGHEQSRPDTSYPPRPDRGHEQLRPDTSYPPGPDHSHEQSRPGTTYQQRQEPPRVSQHQSDHGYPSQQYGSFGQRLPAKAPQQTPAPTVKPAIPPPVTQNPASKHVPSMKEAQEAQRLAKYAASALDFQDMKTAVANLEEALKLLKGA